MEHASSLTARLLPVAIFPVKGAMKQNSVR